MSFSGNVSPCDLKDESKSLLGVMKIIPIDVNCQGVPVATVQHWEQNDVTVQQAKE